MSSKGASVARLDLNQHFSAWWSKGMELKWNSPNVLAYVDNDGILREDLRKLMVNEDCGSR